MTDPLRTRLTARIAQWRTSLDPSVPDYELREEIRMACADELAADLCEVPAVRVVATERELIAAQFGEREPSEAPSQAEMWLREEWWLNHGCAVSSLYGDDGEMQCNAMGCLRDFKREPLETLRVFVTQKRRERLARDLAAARAIAPEDGATKRA